MGRVPMADKKKKGLKTGSIIFIFFLIIYIPSALYWLYGTNVGTEYVRYGTIEDYINTDAIIIRDSTVYKSPISGIYIAEAEEGDKVPSEFRIASIFNSSASNLIEELKQKEAQIFKAQGEKIRNSEIFSRDVLILEEQIAEKLKLIARSSAKNTFSDISKTEEEINELVLKKAKILGFEGSADTYITSLENEKDNIESRIELNCEEIITPEPGILSYVMDDYEEILNKMSISELTPDYFNKVLSEGNSPDSDIWSIEAGEPLAKITHNISFYLAICLDSSKGYQFEVGDIVKLRINDKELECSAETIYKSKNFDGKYILAFELDKYMSDLCSLRSVNIDLIISSYTGKIVPLSCLTDIDSEEETARITLLKANFASIRNIDIIGKNDYYAIVDNGEGRGNNIELYDVYIQNPKNIENGQLIR